MALWLLAAFSGASAQGPALHLVVQTGDASAQITRYSFSKDGRLLLTASGSVDDSNLEKQAEEQRLNFATLWDANTGRELRELRGHTAPVICAVIAPNNETLLTVSADKTARLWSPRTGRETMRLDGTDFVPRTCLFSEDGQLIVLGGERGLIRIYDGSTGKVLRTLTTGGKAILDLDLSPDEKHLAAADGSHLLVLRTDGTGKVAVGGREVGAVSWSEAAFIDTTEYTEDFNGLAEAVSVRRDASTLKEIKTDDVPDTTPKTRPGQKDLADNVVRDSATGKILWEFQSVSSGAYVQLVGEDKSLLVFSNGSRAGDAWTTLWGLDSGSPLRAIQGRTSPLDVISPDGAALCVEEADGGSPENAKVRTLTIDPRSGLDLTEGNHCVKENANGAGDQFVERSRQLLDKYNLNGVAGGMSPDGRFFLAQEGDAAYVHDAVDGKTIAMCMGSAEGFSRDSSRLNCTDRQNVPHVVILPTTTVEGVRAASGISLDGHTLELRRTNGSPPVASIHNVAAFLTAPKQDRVLTRMTDDSVRLFTYNALRPVVALRDVPDDAMLGQNHDDFEAKYRLDPKFGLSEQMVATSYRAEGISASISADGSIVVLGGRYGAYVFSGSTGERLAGIYRFGDNGWAVVAADGRFDTSDLDGQAPMHWVADDSPMQPLALEVFMRDYYTPGLLARLLKGEKAENIPSIASIKNRIQPDVVVKSVSAVAGAPGQVDIVVRAASHVDEERNIASGLQDLRLFRDGQMVGSGSVEVSSACDDAGSARYVIGGYIEGPLRDCDFTFHQVQISADAAKVTFTAYAFNSERIKSATASLEYAPKPAVSAAAVTRRAFLVQIGVNHYAAEGCELNFSVNDAEKMSAALSERMKAQGLVVEPVVMASEKGGDASGAAKEAIRRQLAAIAAKATPDDVFFLSFSGHGYSAADGQFYILPSDVKGSCHGVTEALLRSAISADELAEWLRPIDAGEMTFVLDACHSAESVEANGFKPGPMGSRGLGQLAYDKRMRILAASQSDATAQEYASLQQGLLSYVLTHDGLQEGKADWKPKDGAITLGEWLGYAANAVPAFTLDGGKASGSGSGGGSVGASKTKGIEIEGQTGKGAGKAVQVPAIFDFSKKDTFRVQ